MMDNTIAAASPGIDVKALAKSGAKGAKEDSADKKSGFVDALLTVRGGQQEKSKAADQLLQDDLGEAIAAELPPSDDQPVSASAADDRALQKPVRTDDPVSSRILLSEPSAQPAKPVRPVIDIAAAFVRDAGATQVEVDLPPVIADDGEVVDKDAKLEAKAALRTQQQRQATNQPLPRQEMPVTAESAVTTKSLLHPVKQREERDADEPAKAAADAADDANASKDAMQMLAGQVAAGKATMADHHGASSPSPATDAVRGAEAPSSEDSADRIFRFSRADGKGQSMDMTISGGQSDAESQPAAAKIENVTVLDARRYLGLAPDSNSGSVVGAIAGDPEWSGALQPGNALSNAATQASTGKVVNTLKIQMHPIDLGTVTATMRLNGDELTVELTVETGAAYRRLKDDQSSIIDSLRAHGFAIDQVSVTMAPAADKADTGNGSSDRQGASFAPQQNQDGGGGGASKREERLAARQQGGIDGGSRIDDTPVDTGTASGLGGARPDHVYI